MKILSVQHRGLKRLLEADDAREIKTDQVKKVRRILTALIAASDVAGVQGPPGWHVHPMTGDRAGTWSIWVTGNWRITFKPDNGEIRDLNLEDYH